MTVQMLHIDQVQCKNVPRPNRTRDIGLEWSGTRGETCSNTNMYVLHCSFISDVTKLVKIRIRRVWILIECECE